MALPREKIAELKQILHSQVSQGDVQNHLREILNEEQSTHGGPLGEHEMLERLEHRGIVDDILQQMEFGADGGARRATHFTDKENAFKQPPAKKTNIDPGRRYLYLYIKTGRAFLEHIDDNDGTPGQVASYFTFHIHFRGQRFKSRPIACACEPDIDEGFLLELHKDGAGEAGKMADSTAMLSICDQIHVVLIRTDATGDTSLVSSHFLEWRPVLNSKACRLTTCVELKGTGSESKVTAGVIDIQVELFPKTKQTLSKEVITAQIQLERERHSKQERLFLVYTKQWWKEYLSIREIHRDRLVKIFAQDENATSRPVCSFVKPLRAGRLLDTPREAARFVSLMYLDKEPMLGGGGRAEQWTSMHAFMCRNKGDCEDHAALLCSLLLGFGLNAYVCTGTKLKGSVHAWVMTISLDGLVTFWESVNGHRYIHQPIDPNAPPMDKQHRPKYPYHTVGCVFNHQSFYANNQPSDSVAVWKFDLGDDARCTFISKDANLSVRVQGKQTQNYPSDSVAVCQFDLGDDARWKSMSQDAILSVCGQGTSPIWRTFPPLCSSGVDAALVSNDLEQQLKILAVEHRRDLGLNTAWDDQLSYILTSSLSAYETERVTGLTPGNEEFQDAVQQALPDGHSFKAYPIQFQHRNARKAFAKCLRDPYCADILDCRGDHVRHAVRVKVYTYPESACATWVTFACKYKSIL